MPGSGVLDAGIVMAALNTNDSRHADVRALLRRSTDGTLMLAMSTVNLAEVLMLSRSVTRESGVDVLEVLSAANVQLDAPGTGIARKVAALHDPGRLSLADRFALATAQELRARLYTTDDALAKAAGSLKFPATRL